MDPKLPNEEEGDVPISCKASFTSTIHLETRYHCSFESFSFNFPNVVTSFSLDELVASTILKWLESDFHL